MSSKSKMIKFDWNELGKHYNTVKIEGLTDQKAEMQKKDAVAVRKQARLKREERWAKQEAREERRKAKTPEGMKHFIDSIPEQIEKGKKEIEENTKKRIEEIEKSKDVLLEKKLNSALEQTNFLARKHGLKEPNNPEALKHDRYHCYNCDTWLHWPDAYKDVPEEVIALLGSDEDVRHLCCSCFSKMEHQEIMDIQKGEADSKIRMLVYDPSQVVSKEVQELIDDEKTHTKGLEELQKSKVEKLTKDKALYLKSKLKRYEQITSMIGKVKLTDYEDGDWMENVVTYNAKTRWQACSEG